MTAIKTILACVGAPESAAATLALALKTAAVLEAHLEVLHVRIDAASAVPLVGEGMSGAMIEEMISIAETQASERAKKVRASFDDACNTAEIPLTALPAPGVTAHWREETGREEEVLATAGRLSDLLIMPRPVADSDNSSLMSVNAALMESGRPMLLAPPVPPESLGKHVAILWNGSAEAARAVSAALPFLTKAETVSVFSARESAGMVPEELAGYLAWHGIKARVQTFAPAAQVGNGLLAEVKAAGADMVVMGAYTHSRLRQLILGGVTRHVLQTASMPVLLSH
jgi:nucleotide-binding universal stress UspA family protein